MRALFIFSLACWSSSTAHADLIIHVTGDGNAGSTWTLSGLGTGVAPAVASFTFSGTPFDAATIGSPGTMAVGVDDLTLVSPSAPNVMELNGFNGGNLAGDIASGFFVNGASTPFDGGLAPNTTLVSINSVSGLGQLTITNTPEPSSLALLFSALGLGSWTRRRSA